MSSQLQPSLVGLSGMARRLVSEGALPEDEVRKAIVDSGQKKVTLTTWLLDHTSVDSADLTRIASIEFGMPRMDVTALNPKIMPLDLISEALISTHQALPLFRRAKRLFVGIADPMQSRALDEIKFHSNCMVEPILVERAALRRVIESVLNSMRDVMPEMGGPDLARLLLTFYPGLKCLFMSGYADSVITDSGVTNNQHRLIRKPFSIQELAAKVRVALAS